MIEAEWWEYDTSDEMADAVAGDVGFIIESALDARNDCLLALPGGKSPIPIFDRLKDAKINWKRVTIVPGDDRLVPVDDPLSNVALLAKHFMPLGARVVPTVSANLGYRQAGDAAATLCGYGVDLRRAGAGDRTGRMVAWGDTASRIWLCLERPFPDRAQPAGNLHLSALELGQRLSHVFPMAEWTAWPAPQAGGRRGIVSLACGSVAARPI